MSKLTENLALGAAATVAGGVVVGAALLGANAPRTLSGNNGGSSGSGGGTTVTVSVAEIHPEVDLTNPATGDVFLSPRINVSTTFKDFTTVGYTLTAPNGNTCELPTGGVSSGDWETSAVNNTTIDISTCQGGEYGQYTLKAYSHGFATSDSRYAEDNITFTYSLFSVNYSTFDNNADPIVIIRYGEGIKIVSLVANRVGDNRNILGDELKYVVENNEDHADEIVLPFNDKQALVGSYVVTATALKADGSPINSQDTTSATVTTNFEYYGIQTKEDNE